MLLRKREQRDLLCPEDDGKLNFTALPLTRTERRHWRLLPHTLQERLLSRGFTALMWSVCRTRPCIRAVTIETTVYI